MPFRIFGREFGKAPGEPSHPALVALRAEVGGKSDWYRLRRADQLEAGKAILAATPLEQVRIVVAAVERAASLNRDGPRHFAEVTALGRVISDLLRRDLPLTEADLVTLLDNAREFPHSYGLLPTAAFVRTAERFVGQGGLGEPLRKALDGLRRALGPAPSRQEDRKLRARLEALLEGAKPLDLKPGGAWADAVLASLAAMAEPERDAWRRLLSHAQSGAGAAPSQKWLKAAEPLVRAVGPERLRDRAVRWFELVAPPKDGAPPARAVEEFVTAVSEAAGTLLHDVDERTRAAWTALVQAVTQAPNRQENLSAAFEALLASPRGTSLLPRASELVRGLTGSGPLLAERHADTLRGLVWTCTLVPDSERLAIAVGSLAQRCLRKVPGYGAFSSKLGHACLWTLGAMSGLEPVAQLGRLKQRVKYPVSLRLVDKALAEAARRASLSPEDLEERAVPTYGLTEPGLGHTVLGEYEATVRVTGVSEVELCWTGPRGPQKAIPQEVQREHADQLKHLKRGVKDIATMLPAQRDRIERLFCAGDRHWPLAEWRVLYLDHPLISVVTRRLIWHFEEGGRSALGAFHGGRIVGVDGAPLALSDATEVRLWHPLGFPPETVLAWRAWLREHEVRQPFKQAHREIYILTDAELETSIYSNRFAAHIVRQHQFAALCRERGWRYHLQGAWDSYNVPTLPLPRFGLQAEFCVEPLMDNDAEQSGMGIYMQLATDQVRFADAEGPRPLTEVPALVFSEVMRDVDLFVGVTSIAADPTWADRGDDRARAYWRSYAFGDLNASATTRREVLGELLPKLKIASCCTLEGRFLRVQGKLGAYKIHLGSTNILMEPNDQYLCVVPDRRAGANPSRDLALPFEGDTALSIIISKALLLAADDRITDETILRQIRRDVAGQ